MASPFLRIGIAAGGIGVALGAFGAHALASRVSAADLATFETGVRYLMYHALALIGLGVLAAPPVRSRWLVRAGWLLTGGTLVFSGSLFLLVFTGARWLGAVTPLGGVALLLGWVSFSIGVWRESA